MHVQTGRRRLRLIETSASRIQSAKAAVSDAWDAAVRRLDASGGSAVEAGSNDA